MSYRVRVRCVLQDVPAVVVGRMRARLRDISHTLEAVSRSDSFWSSMAENPLYVDLHGWRFRYSIDRARKEFVVLDVSRTSETLPPGGPFTPAFKKQA
ncbi:MAG TPA: hypothetical protein VG496_06895 [Myxococcales bacterium]|nr:hypothetical protein [Myxococcales bacterium]